MTDLSHVRATDSQIRETAREAGEGAATRAFDLLFGRLGVNTSDQEEMRELKRDFAHLRQQRTKSEEVRSHLRRGVIERTLAGLWTALAAGGALLAGSWLSRSTHGP